MLESTCLKEKLLSYDGTFCIHFDRKRTKSYIEGIKTAKRVSIWLQSMSKFLQVGFGIKTLPNSKNVTVANAVKEVITDFDLKEKISNYY
ncbi:hypothetical protein A3Q56_06731 [Intoshia linei]|uniref:Uncharacterized protein n=1 Tax=Intoshia linei TaxID=1819745 RepID=A0A177AVL2_9BILA|nr:hypothetical protein A3Q56_06731 [Intoshia linei]